MEKPKIISLVGLTSSGKTGLGIELAKRFNGEIVSCDSRQIYRGLDIGTGKVTPEEAQGIPHHLIDIVDPGRPFDVYRFQQLAFATIDDILARGKLPILVGGTGLYSRAVVENFDFSQPDKIQERRYNVLQIALMPDKVWLGERIALRNNERFKQGMLDELRGLIDAGVCENWLRGLGYEYRLNMRLLYGWNIDEYNREFHTKSMQYAKRQRTWFKRERDTIFLNDPNKFLDECTRLVEEATK